MEHAIKLEDWRLVYIDKEAKEGPVRFEWAENGKARYSKRILQSSGIFALTYDGKWYMMGQPRKDWVLWLLKTHKIRYDAKNPLNMLGGH